MVMNYFNYVRIIIVLKGELEFLHQPKKDFMIILTYIPQYIYYIEGEYLIGVRSLRTQNCISASAFFYIFCFILSCVLVYKQFKTHC